MRCYIPKHPEWFLTQVGMGQFCLPGNIWQCLQAFLVLQCGETSLAYKAEDKDTTNHTKIKMHRTGYYNKQSDIWLRKPTMASLRNSEDKHYPKDKGLKVVNSTFTTTWVQILIDVFKYIYVFCLHGYRGLTTLCHFI